MSLTAPSEQNELLEQVIHCKEKLPLFFVFGGQIEQGPNFESFLYVPTIQVSCR